MPNESTTKIEDVEQAEAFVQIEEPKKRQKQIFHRAIKRDYQRNKFYQKTR